jgi:hypothetical protein
MLRNFLSIMLVACFTFGSTAFASSGDDVKRPELNDVKELHEYVSKQHFAKIDSKGQLTVTASAYDIGVSEDLYNEYLEGLKLINFGVEKGIMSFDKNDFEVNVVSTDEIEQQLTQKTFLNKIQMIAPLSDPGAPKLNVTSLVRSNRAELERVWQSAVQAGKFGKRVDPFTFTSTYFAAKVRENGDWDYKVVSGYSPWYREFIMTFPSGRSVQNSAYLGNYNYGYTGQFLFTKNQLLLAGDAVSILTKGTVDGEDDKAPIRKGFDDAVNYR